MIKTPAASHAVTPCSHEKKVYQLFGFQIFFFFLIQFHASTSFKSDINLHFILNACESNNIYSKKLKSCWATKLMVILVVGV